MTLHPSTPSFECADDIPLHWVRANQLGILLCIIITIIIGQPWLLAVALIVQLTARWLGVQHNIFIRLFTRLLPASTRTESRELLRFNNLLAILFLLGCLISFAFQATVVAYVFLAMLTIAVVLALSGFCIGCFIYYQWKQFWLRYNRRSRS
ncbi:MAG: DUF4395 domain-containing protein [Paenibacillaceae bacterium]